MKNLVKFLVVVISFTVTTELFAQNFGIKAGVNLANMVMESDGISIFDDEIKIKAGFHIGLIAAFSINDMLSFETGLLLSTKGYRESGKLSGQGWSEEYKNKLNLLYLDIPLNAKASIDLGNMKAYGTFGPYIGLGLSGKRKAEWEWTDHGESGSGSYEDDVKFGSDKDKDDLKRFDFGLAIGGGVEISNIQVGLSYGLGLANLSPSGEIDYFGNVNINNRVLAISVCYKFGGK